MVFWMSRELPKKKPPNDAAHRELLRDAGLIAVFGAVGGFVYYVYVINFGPPPRQPFPWNAMSYCILGFFSSLIGIFIILVPDKQQPVRRFALAIACGFCFQPVLDATRLLIKDNTQRETRSQFAQSYKDLIVQTEKLASAGPHDKAKSMEKVASATTQVIRQAAESKDRDSAEEAIDGAFKAIDALQRAFSANPVHGSEAFAKIATSATLYNNPEVASSALKELSGVTNNLVANKGDYSVIPIYMEKTGEVAEAAKRANQVTHWIHFRQLSVQNLIAMVRTAIPKKGDYSILIRSLKAAMTEMKEISRFISENDLGTLKMINEQIRELNELLTEIEKG